LKSQKVILLLGGNQGDVEAHFSACIELLDKQLGKIFARSNIYSTKAWGPVSQPDFLNMAVGLYTAWPPSYLLKALLDVEKRLGRRRDVRFGPRTLDIDILFYGQQIIRREGLQVPHPEIQNRRFALVPVNEIAAKLIHPTLGKTLETLLQTCEDRLEVRLWKS
jgi:2-amino-4-hydroxy-6-hydroxymethyldihydropteridine diphosphokinase